MDEFLVKWALGHEIYPLFSNTLFTSLMQIKDLTDDSNNHPRWYDGGAFCLFRKNQWLKENGPTKLFPRHVL
ncbi:MAG: hypothetical protein ACOYZ8_05710 [Chloroflexota bacterium]